MPSAKRKPKEPKHESTIRSVEDALLVLALYFLGEIFDLFATPLSRLIFVLAMFGMLRSFRRYLASRRLGEPFIPEFGITKSTLDKINLVGGITSVILGTSVFYFITLIAPLETPVFLNPQWTAIDLIGLIELIMVFIAVFLGLFAIQYGIGKVIVALWHRDPLGVG